MDNDLWQFLSQLPSSLQFQIFIALMVGGAIGIVFHYLKMWYSDSIKGSLYNYLFVAYPGRTAISVISYIAWAIGLVGTHAFFTQSNEFIGWGLVFAMGFTNGYSIDTVANKGT